MREKRTNVESAEKKTLTRNEAAGEYNASADKCRAR